MFDNLFMDIFQNIQNLHSNYPLFLYAVIMFLGATIGSFLNVIIYRTPIMLEFEIADVIKANADNVHKNIDDAFEKGKGMTLSLPRSRCSCCGKTIPWYHNIPILSYFILKGKCYSCKESFSSRYAIIEVINTVAWLLLFNIFGLTLTFVVTAILFSLLLILSMIDFDTKLLPNDFVFLVTVLGILYQSSSVETIGLQNSIYEALILFFISYAFISVYSKIRGKLMMGFGDIKLIGALTLYIGMFNAVYAILIACLIGILYYTMLILMKKVNDDRTFAFGPFLCLGFYGVFIWTLLS
jgi:leader peptidase (prepilin peptidase)/N-methyltransferase